MIPLEVTRLELVAKRSENLATIDRCNHAIAAIDCELARYEAPLLAAPRRHWAWLLALCVGGLIAASYTSNPPHPATTANHAVVAVPESTQR